MILKIITFILLVIGSMILLSGCNITNSGNAINGTGSMVSRSFNVGDFTELEVGGGSSFTVIFRQSDDISVNVEMQENLFDFHEVSVNRDRLTISRTTNNRILYGNQCPQVKKKVSNWTFDCGEI